MIEDPALLTKTPKRAVLYLRLSETTEVSTSIVRQEQDLRAYCEGEGWTVLEPLVDDGVSGGIKRAKADEALAMLVRGDAEVVICWKFDRFSRTGVRAMADIEDALEAAPAGAMFVAVQDGLRSDNTSWRMQTAIMSELARSERAAIKLRVSNAMKYLRTVGRWTGGTVPYGYKSVKDPNSKGQILVIDPVEAEEVQDMASRVLAYESLYSIMRDLNDRAVLTRSATIVRDRIKNELPLGKVKATTWSIQAIKTLLTSDVICGRVLHKGRSLRDDSGMPKEQWPPVLDIETVSSLRMILNPEKPPGVIRRRKHDARLLSGLVRCAQCGKPLYPKHLSKDKNGKPRPIVYDCSTRSSGGECEGCSTQAEPLEAFVLEQFLEKRLYSPVFEFVESTKNEIEAAEIEKAIQDTLSEMAEDAADIEALSSRLQILKSRRAEAAKTKPELLLRHTAAFYTPDYMAGLSTAEKRALLIPNVESLTISKGTPGRHGLDASRINIEWRTLTPENYGENWDDATKALNAERVAAVKAALKKNYEDSHQDLN